MLRGHYIQGSKLSATMIRFSDIVVPTVVLLHNEFGTVLCLMHMLLKILISMLKPSKWADSQVNPSYMTGLQVFFTYS